MSKKAIAGLVFLCVVTFFYAVLAAVPAKWVLGTVNQYFPDFYAENVSGTLWEGRASQVIVKANGVKLPLGETQWTLKGWPLLMGRAELELKTKHKNQYIDGNFWFSYPNQFGANETQASIPANLIRQWYPLPIMVAGQVELTIKALAAQEQLVTELNGALSWQNAELNFGQGDMPLGSFVAELSNNDENIIMANLIELQGDLGVSGEAQFNQSSRAYQAKVYFSPKPSANQVIAGTVTQMGLSQSDGRYLHAYSGTL